MPKSLDDIIRELPPKRRERVEARAQQLIAIEMKLRELRKKRGMTQEALAEKLGITQDGVSRLEQRRDVRISTLRKTVEAMGGSLKLVAEFPDYPPVVLSGLGRSAANTYAYKKATSRAKKGKAGKGG